MNGQANPFTNSYDNNNNSFSQDDTCKFLKSRLDEALAEIDTKKRHQMQLQSEVENLSKVNKEQTDLVSKLRLEMQSYEAKVMDAEKRQDKEARLRFETQDRLGLAEKKLKEVIASLQKKRG